MKNKENKWIIVIVLILLILFPFLLNWLLLRKTVVPIVGDETVWLSFWPVYLSAIASFGMIYFTYRSLQQNKKQIEEMQRQYEEVERARLVFSVIVYQHAFMLKISNIGKRNVYNAIIEFNEDFLSELLQERFQEGYRQLSKPFFIEAGTSKHLFIGFCQDVNDTWKNKHVVIRMKGNYNDIYTIDEEIDMDLFLDKTFMLVQGELATALSQIKQGLVNNSYSPIQVNVDRIAKSLSKIESSLNSITECLEEQEDGGCENDVESLPTETIVTETTNENRPEETDGRPS